MFVVIAAFAALVLAAFAVGEHPSTSHAHGETSVVAETPQPSVTPTEDPGPASSAHPNIVFVLTDDLSDNLVQYMPQVKALQAEGETFSNYTVTDSLCCPSRSSIFTGEFPHNTGVRSNVAPTGGYAGFMKHGDEKKSFAIQLEKAGYTTGFEGKYLNQYEPQREPVNPEGWNYWAAVNGHGYYGYRYTMSVNGKIKRYGTAPHDYMTTILNRDGNHFIRRAGVEKKPFMLEVASFAPHEPYVPAKRDLGTFAGLKVPHTAPWDTLPKNAPAWLARHDHPITAHQRARDNNAFVRRVESVQAVDRMIASLRATLKATGQLANTVFVFSSDNGYHIGEYRLAPGKQTAFDTDIRVPLIITGPGIAPGSVDTDPVENIDLAPTFEQLAGARIPQNTVDGHSFVALLHGQNPTWRTWAGIEHLNPGVHASDPDEQSAAAGHLPSYDAIRSAQDTYVKYANGEREFYDRTDDPHELDNIYDTLSRKRVAALNTVIAQLSRCSGYLQCWQAAVPVAHAQPQP